MLTAFESLFIFLFDKEVIRKHETGVFRNVSLLFAA